MAPLMNQQRAMPAPPTPDLLTPAELFVMTKTVLTEDMVRKINAVFQFEISGENGGTWCLDLRNGEGYVGKGKAPCEADVTISMSSADFQGMYYGRLSPTDAYMGGKMGVQGDIKATMRLEELIRSIKEQQARA